MVKSRLFSAFCVCVFSLAVSHISHAAPVQYDYTGNPFDSNDGTYPRCLLGDPECFTNISATIDLSGALGSDMALHAITPDAWSISDGLTTVTDQTAEFDLYALEVGTDATGNIVKWNFSVNRNDTQPLDELAFMRSTSGAGESPVDDTRYCTEFTGGACSYTAVALLDNDPGIWTIATVPLPASAWLLGSSLVGLLGVVRRKKMA